MIYEKYTGGVQRGQEGLGQPGVRVFSSLLTVQPWTSQLLYLKPLSTQQ